MINLMIRSHPTIFKNALQSIQRRNLFVKTAREEKYRIKDQISEKFKLVYKAPMENYLSACNNVTTLSGVLLGTFLGIKYSYPNMDIAANAEVPYASGILVSTQSDLLYFTIGFIVINIALRVMVYRYPLRIYRNDSKYIAMFEGQVPFTKSKVKFTKGDVTEVADSGVLPWRDSRYKISNRNVLLLSEFFKTPSELYEMMKKPTEKTT
ncbi:unnamed protein product [Diamesa tonsa]